MEIINQALESIGSVNSFASSRGLDPAQTETFSAYTKELTSHRQKLAELGSISLDALHSTTQINTSETTNP